MLLRINTLSRLSILYGFNKYAPMYVFCVYFSETMSIQIFHFIQERLEDWRANLMIDKKKIYLWSKRMHLALKAYQVFVCCVLYMHFALLALSFSVSLSRWNWNPCSAVDTRPVWCYSWSCFGAIIEFIRIRSRARNDKSQSTSTLYSRRVILQNVQDNSVEFILYNTSLPCIFVYLVVVLLAAVAIVLGRLFYSKAFPFYTNR